MNVACFEGNYKCRSPLNLPFHYKTNHNDRISNCARGYDLSSGICFGEAIPKLRGTVSKCSSSNLSSSFSNSSSNYNSNYNTITNSNLPEALLILFPIFQTTC